MKRLLILAYAALCSVIWFLVGGAVGYERAATHVCQSYFTGYAIQQCKERVRLGEPVFNEVRE